MLAVDEPPAGPHLYRARAALTAEESAAQWAHFQLPKQVAGIACYSSETGVKKGVRPFGRRFSIFGTVWQPRVALVASSPLILSDHGRGWCAVLGF